jgi:hypothetical protein
MDNTEKTLTIELKEGRYSREEVAELIDQINKHVLHESWLDRLLNPMRRAVGFLPRYRHRAVYVQPPP